MLPRTPLDRRSLLRSGGMTLGIGALLAACSDDEAGEPGRVGYAPPITPLPTVVVDDAVLLRTASSLEYSILAVYETAMELGVLDATESALFERFASDHTEHAAMLSDLTVSAGGEPYECPNPFMMDRMIGPILVAITGDPDADIPPSDDQVRDLLASSNALESIVGATYQQFVGLLADLELRRELVLVGAHEVRHAAAVAVEATGAPAGYISPVLLGAELTPDESGLVPAYAISSRFGSLAPIELVVGAQNDVGTRTTVLLQTPAENSFVYADMTCDG